MGTWTWTTDALPPDNMLVLAYWPLKCSIPFFFVRLRNGKWLDAHSGAVMGVPPCWQRIEPPIGG